MSYQSLILFDIDGVVRDVSNSYRLAAQKTVNHFCGWNPTNQDIDKLKNEGHWNNDWDLSLELIKRYIKVNRLSIAPPKREKIIYIFERLYFGCNPKEKFFKWSGFIKNETIMVEKDFFTDLSKNKIGWGFVSGAEKPSAKFVLEKKIGLKNPPLIAMGDAPDKPNPEGLLRLSKQLLKEDLNENSPPIAFIGDTIADIKTITNAKKIIPKQRFISIGIAPPHLQHESLLKERYEYETKLKNEGADLIINSVKELTTLHNSIFESHKS